MSKEEIQQQILDAITSGKIQVTNINFGDHIEHQHKIEKVEAGGVGFQIFGASKTDMPQPKPESPVDDILPIPPKGKYTKVREYITERCRFDKEFKTMSTPIPVSISANDSLTSSVGMSMSTI